MPMALMANMPPSVSSLLQSPVCRGDSVLGEPSNSTHCKRCMAMVSHCPDTLAYAGLIRSPLNKYVLSGRLLCHGCTDSHGEGNQSAEEG